MSEYVLRCIDMRGKYSFRHVRAVGRSATHPVDHLVRAVSTASLETKIGGYARQAGLSARLGAR